jgi:hypothetical protein
VQRHVGTRHCRVVANPRGYASKGEQTLFREQFCVEIDLLPSVGPM